MMTRPQPRRPLATSLALTLALASLPQATWAEAHGAEAHGAEAPTAESSPNPAVWGAPSAATASLAAHEESRQMRYLMGTLWTVEARGPAPAAPVEAAFAEIARLDRLLSTYRADSELSRVNRDAAQSWVPVSAETSSLVARALDMARKSEGAFDPTVGPLVQLWGFKHLDYRFPAEPDLRDARQRVDYRDVTVDPARGIRFGRAGMELDLGAIAKGYAIDRAVSLLRARGMTSIRVDAGGNQGIWGPPLEGERWVFGVRHPRLDGALLGATAGEGGSVSTSGDAERGFWKDGVRYGHVIDPRTGQAVQGIMSVTVWARDAETADALSTALFVMGPDRGKRLLAAYPGAEALWVTARKESEGYAIQRSAGFPWKPAVPADRDKLVE